MYIRKRLGKYYVEIKRQGHKNIYKTFKQKSDAMKWGRSVEIQLDQSRYRDTSNASKTTLISVLERHLRERLRVVRQPNKEQSRYNVIIKHDIVKRYLSNLTPQIFARYRDDRLDQGMSASTVCRELSDRKSTRLNSSHGYISYAVFCLKKKKKTKALILAA